MTTASLVGLVVLGAVASGIGTLIGAGGAFIAVPVLLMARPELSPAAATGAGLFMVLVNATLGAARYARMGRVHFPSAIRFAAATLPGAMAGVWAVRRVSGAGFSALFGGLLLVIAVLLGRRALRAPLPSDDTTTRTRVDPRGVAASAIVGFVATFFGVGGGILQVPILAAWLRYPVPVAVATSLLIAAVTAAVGVATHLATAAGLPDHWPVAAALACGALVGASVGARLSRHVGSRGILLGVAGAFVIAGARLIYAAL